MPEAAAPDLAAAASAVDVAKGVVDTAARHLAGADQDTHQTAIYELAHAAAAVENASAVLDYGSKGEVEGRIACAFVADAVYDVATKVLGREDEFGLDGGALSAAM